MILFNYNGYVSHSFNQFIQTDGSSISPVWSEEIPKLSSGCKVSAGDSYVTYQGDKKSQQVIVTDRGNTLTEPTVIKPLR